MNMATKTPPRPETATLDGFSGAVLEILTEHVTTRHAVTREDLETITGQITKAYETRVKPLQGRLGKAVQQIRDLSINDRAANRHLAQMQKTLTEVTGSQHRYHLHADVLTDRLTELQAVLDRAAETGAVMVSIAELRATLKLPRQVWERVRQAGPMPVSVLPADGRWQAGIFEDSAGNPISCPYIGEAVVVRPAVPDQIIEPVFQYRGADVVLSMLLAQGLTYKYLI